MKSNSVKNHKLLKGISNSLVNGLFIPDLNVKIGDLSDNDKGRLIYLLADNINKINQRFLSYVNESKFIKEGYDKYINLSAFIMKDSEKYPDLIKFLD